MREAWRFEHTVEVRAGREAAWTFWSNVANWAEVDPAVEWARVDGGFVAGARGETKPVGAPANAWTLAEVDAGRRAVIAMGGPGVDVRFVWTFGEASNGGAVLTQVVEVSGEDLEPYSESLEGMAAGIPAGMMKLAAAIERAGVRPPN